ncbi:MAG: hypothetical protein JSV65_16275 [Armatimonadota bacterium]|nr:MAG: hypothetical protein JSV65_16275 [Armatimonadota bacterium]
MRDSNTHSKPPGRGPIIPFALRVALVVIVVVVAVYLLLLVELQRALKPRLERLHALGVPQTWAELVPPPIPDDENAAILYEQAFAQLNLQQGRQAIWDYVADQGPGRASLRAQVEFILTSNEAALDLVKEGAARPRCRFAQDWAESPYAQWSNSPHLPALMTLRQSARLLAAESLLAADGGDAERAFDSLRAGLGLSAHALSRPPLIGYASGIACEAITLNALPDVLEGIDLSADDCRLLYDGLERLDLDDTFRDVLIGDAFEALWLFEVTDNEPAKAREMLLGEMRVYEVPSGMKMRAFSFRLRLYTSSLTRLPRLGEEIAYCDAAEQAFALAKAEGPEAVVKWQALHDRLSATPSYHLITRGHAPSARVGMARYRAVTLRNAMQVALALEAYHTEHGAYPDSFDALRDYPGWPLPKDPYSGKDFAYSRKSDGCVLYSWSEDLDDDGGRAFLSHGLDGDWVWEFER